MRGKSHPHFPLNIDPRAILIPMDNQAATVSATTIVDHTESLDQSPISLRVSLKPDVYEKYLHQSVVSSRGLSDVLSDRLAKYVDSTDSKPIVFTDVERQRLEKVLKRNVSSAEELTELVLRACAIEVGGMTVQLYPKLADRLQSRCLGRPLDRFIAEIVTRSLEEYVGLR